MKTSYLESVYVHEYRTKNGSRFSLVAFTLYFVNKREDIC